MSEIGELSSTEQCIIKSYRRINEYMFWCMTNIIIYSNVVYKYFNETEKKKEEITYGICMSSIVSSTSGEEIKDIEISDFDSSQKASYYLEKNGFKDTDNVLLRLVLNNGDIEEYSWDQNIEDIPLKKQN
jgi:hypothetical protein